MLALAIQAFLVKPYRIPSESMEPTLTVGQRVLVNRVTYRLREPKVGDVVVFHPPPGADRPDAGQCGVEAEPDQACARPVDGESNENFIKRIVAGPGDRLAIENGRPILNGEPAEDEFWESCGAGLGCDLPREITVPPGHYFMMGDNRGASQDSRFWGPVSEDQIVGRAFFTYWPPRRIGFL